MITNSQIKKSSKESLRCNWGIAIGFTLIIFIIAGISGIIIAQEYFIATIASFIIFLIGGMMAIVQTHFFVNISRFKTASISNSFRFSVNNFFKAFTAYLLLGLYTFFWSLLLIIPGFIKSLAYSMTFYILSDNPKLTPSEAISLSEEMMKGHKLDLFTLILSFIGWLILVVLTIGIVSVYVVPYMNTTISKFYDEVKRDYALKLDNSELLT